GLVGVVGIDDAVDVRVGDSHACALHAGGEVSCWGAGWFGQLGQGTFLTGAPTPLPVPSLDGVAGIAVGADVSCAFRGEGGAFCWGHGEFGRLGNGSAEDADAPVQVEGLEGVTAMEVGDQEVC